VEEVVENVKIRPIACIVYATYFHNAAYILHILAHISPNSAYCYQNGPNILRKNPL